MSSKLFGVSPPPLGQALDSKIDLKKDFKETSSAQYKTDFEKTLKEKLTKKDKDVDVGPPKEMKAKKDDKEPKVAKETDEEKDSSGGIKKRMSEKVDDQMISMIMASNESEIEIPESKNDLAEIEESQPQAKIESVMIGATAFAVQPQTEAVATAVVKTQPAAIPALNAMNEVIVPAEASLAAQELPPELMQKLQGLQQPADVALPTMAVQDPTETEISEEVLPKFAMQTQKQKQTPMADQAAGQVVGQIPVSEIAPQDQLASEVQQIRHSYDPSLVQPQAEPQKSDESEDFYIQPTIEPKQPLMDAAVPSIEKALPQVQAVQVQAAQIAVEAPAVPVQQAEVAMAAMAAPLLASVLKTDGNGQTVKVFDLEKDLNDEVGFEPEVDNGSSEVKADEKPISLKAQEFQKSVYEQLQKMDQRPPAAAMQSNVLAHEGQDAKAVVQSEEKPANGLKAEALNPNEVHHVGQTQHEFKSQAAAPIFAGSEQHRAQMIEDNHEKNIQEVMHQAQYLVKKGGGEMKVSMSPDGLAEVQLKVMLQNGKVNIEMNTHDKTVRKLMEDSLTELKSGLAAQNLSVEHVKINTVTATNTDNSAQFQSNWNHSGGEQQQREYWNQFQDNLNQKQSSSRRSNYGGESSGISSMSASAVDDRIAATPRTYGGTKGSQINWVA